MAAYCEVHGWPKGKWERGDFDGERRLHCYWADVTAVLADLDGSPQWPWQAYPWGAADALIYSAEVVGIGQGKAAGGSQTAVYDRALIIAKYTTRGPRYNPTYGHIEERWVSGGESFAVDHSQLRWADGSTVDPNDAPIVHRDIGEYIVTFHNLTAVPAWVLTRQGGVNSTTFSTIGLGLVFAAGTLKYGGCQISGKYSLGYLPRYHVTAKFEYRNVGWNKHWRPGAVEWQAMKTVDGANYTQYPEVGMSL